MIVKEKDQTMVQVIKKTGKVIEIVRANSNVFYSAASISKDLQIPLELAQIIVEENEDNARDCGHGNPKGFIPSFYVKALSDPDHRLALDLAMIALQFDPALAKQLASDLPWSEDLTLGAMEANEYSIKRVGSGIQAALLKLNNLPKSLKRSNGLLKTREVADLLGISPQQVRGLVKAGKIDSELSNLDSGHYRFTIEAVSYYQQQIEESQPAESLDEVPSVVTHI